MNFGQLFSLFGLQPDDENESNDEQKDEEITEIDFQNELQKYPIIRSFDSNIPESPAPSSSKNPSISSNSVVSIPEDSPFPKQFEIFLSQFPQPLHDQIIKEFWKQHFLMIQALSLDDIERILKRIEMFRQKSIKNEK